MYNNFHDMESYVGGCFADDWNLLQIEIIKNLFIRARCRRNFGKIVNSEKEKFKFSENKRRNACKWGSCRIGIIE
jgi:hypothetical protein